MCGASRSIAHGYRAPVAEDRLSLQVRHETDVNSLRLYPSTVKSHTRISVGTCVVILE